jgi:hypothetical protein
MQSNAHDIGIASHFSSVLLDIGFCRVRKKTAQPDTREDQRRIMPVTQECLPECIEEKARGCAVCTFVHDGNCQRFPETAAHFSGLTVSTQPLGDRHPCRHLRLLHHECRSAAKQGVTVMERKQRRMQNSPDNVQRRWKMREAEVHEASCGMMKLKKGLPLHINKVTRANAVEKGKRAAVPGNQEVLSVVDLVARDGITKGARTAAEHGFLFQEENRDAGNRKLNGCCKPAESAADNYDRLAPARFHRGPRFSQEYFSLWLSQ